jgi:hypothetical protein
LEIAEFQKIHEVFKHFTNRRNRMTALEPKLDVVLQQLCQRDTTLPLRRDGALRGSLLTASKRILPGILNTASGTMTPTGIRHRP